MPTFKEEQIQENPLLEAADNNGYFQAQVRWQTVYGPQFWQITNPNKFDDVPSIKVSYVGILKTLFRQRVPIRDTNPDLYLANINGRDYLEGRYLLSCWRARNGPRNTLQVFCVIFLIYLAVVGYFAAHMFLYLSTWIMMVSYGFMVYEIHRSACAFPSGLFLQTIRAEITRWKNVEKFKDGLGLFVKEIEKFILAMIVIIPLIIAGAFAIGFFIFSVGWFIRFLNKFYTSQLSPYFYHSFVEFYAQLVVAFILVGFGLLLAVTRGHRKHSTIINLQKVFEDGRREYDRYFVCKVQGDLVDGNQWISFYYDQAFEQFARESFPHPRYAETPFQHVHGFDPYQRHPQVNNPEDSVPTHFVDPNSINDSSCKLDERNNT